MPITTNSELLERIKDGVQKGVASALSQHKKDGNSIVVWRNGKVEQIAAENIQRSKA